MDNKLEKDWNKETVTTKIKEYINHKQAGDIAVRRA